MNAHPKAIRGLGTPGMATVLFAVLLAPEARVPMEWVTIPMPPGEMLARGTMSLLSSDVV